MNYLFLIFFILLLFIFFIENGKNNTSLDIRNFRLMDTKNVNIVIDELKSQQTRSFIDERALPSTFDCWNNAVNVVDQGPWGSCTSFSMRYAYLIKLANANTSLIEPSTAFLYDQARIREGNSSLNDTGATNTDMAWVVQNLGVPPEINFPYTAFNLFNKPQNVQGLQKYNMTMLYLSSNVNVNILNFKNILNQKKGLIIAFYVYSSMMTKDVFITGNIPLPSSRDKLLGGHSIMLSGWNDNTQRFIFRNSWGKYTGINGIFTIPYAYVASTKYAGDAWYFT